MPPRYIPRIVVVAGVDLTREPFVPDDFKCRTDWRCGIAGCGKAAEKVFAVPLGGQRELFGVSCARHLDNYETQLREALEFESLQAAEFDAQMQRVN